MKGFVGVTGRSTWRPFGPERLDMSSSTCLKAEGLSTGLPAVFLEDLSASPPPSHNEDGQERRLSSFPFINNHPENSY
jgi:hypothetical protein